MKNLISITGFLLTVICADAQENLTAKLSDSSGKAVAGANVLLKKSASGGIITFTVSASDGGFTLVLPGNVGRDSAIVQVISSGFESYAVAVRHLPSQIMLQRRSTLPDVIVRSSPPIVSRNDTITYDVRAFTDRQDRVIADVIRKLPGVEVSAAGTITYKGKSINHFYIEGDDLLGGRYGVATNNIPSDAVEKVQILENHQHIRALKDKMFSDEPAMNIVLNDKTKIKLLHVLGAGAGLPKVYQVDYTNMLFRKKIKLLNVAKTNNTGIDVDGEMVSHTLQQDFTNVFINERPLLNVSGDVSPPVSKTRYNFNQSKLFTSNLLQRFSNSLSLKINTTYSANSQERRAFTSNAFYLPGDTITYSERTVMQQGPSLFRTEVNLNNNSEKRYLNNSLQFSLNTRKDRSDVMTNLSPYLNQYLDFRQTSFSNQFTMLTARSKNTITEVNSFIANRTVPQSLSITPGLYAGSLNAGNLYSLLRQSMSIPQFYTINSIRFSRMGKYLTPSLKIGGGYLDQELVSDIALHQFNGDTKQLPDSFRNSISWKESFVFMDASIIANLKRMKIAASMPARVQWIQYTMQSVNPATYHTRFLNLAPQVNFRYTLKNGNSIFGSSRYQDDPGSLLDIYPGFVLSHYRALNASRSPLVKNRIYSSSAGFTYHKAARFFTANAILTQDKTRLNYIASSTITDSLQFAIKQIGHSNEINRTNFNISLSKYFFPMRTNITGGSGMAHTNFLQYQNGQLLSFITNAYSLKFSIRTKLSPVVATFYEINAIWANSKQQSDALTFINPPARQSRQQLHLNFYLSDNFGIQLKGERFGFRTGTSTHINSFADVIILFRPAALKTDIEIFCMNIFDNKLFGSVVQNANMLSIREIALRERMLVVKAGFRF